MENMFYDDFLKDLLYFTPPTYTLFFTLPHYI